MSTKAAYNLMDEEHNIAEGRHSQRIKEVLLDDDLAKCEEEHHENNVTDFKKLYGLLVVSVVSSLFLLKIYFKSQPQGSGLNLFNFYKALTYLCLSTFHVHWENINLADKRNYKNRYFFQVIIHSFTNNMAFVGFLFCVRYFEMTEISTLVAMLVVLFTLASFRVLRKLDYIIMGSVTVYVLILPFIHVTEEEGTKSSNLWHFFAMLLFITCYQISSAIIKRAPVHFHVICISTSFNAIVFTPILVSVFKETTAVTFPALLLIVLTSACLFYVQYSLDKLSKYTLDNKAKYLNLIVFLVCSLGSYVFFGENPFNFYNLIALKLVGSAAFSDLLDTLIHRLNN